MSSMTSDDTPRLADAFGQPQEDPNFLRWSASMTEQAAGSMFGPVDPGAVCDARAHLRRCFIQTAEAYRALADAIEAEREDA